MAALRKFFSKKLQYSEPVGSEDSNGHALLAFFGEDASRQLRACYTNEHIGIVTLELKDFYSLRSPDQDILGPRIMDTLEYEAIREIPNIFHHARFLFSERIGFCCVFLAFCISEDVVSFANATQLFRIQVRERINRSLLSSTKGIGDVMAGYAYIPPRQQGPFSEVLFKAYCHSRRFAGEPKELASLPLYDEFRWILEKGRITTCFQPVIEFKHGGVVGWEAFSRGPENSFFEPPQTLFQLAGELDCTFELEALCRDKALQSLGGLEPHQKLFLNNLNEDVNNPGFSAGQLRNLIEPYGLTPQNVVLEFAERQGFRDMTMFFKAIESFRKEGFAIAIDDVGSGDSSLRNLTQIRPDYIKIDLSLIDGIDSNPYHRSMVETLAFLAGKLGASIIAVGIETETELSSLVSMGVDGGQGNLIGKPAQQKASPSVTIPAKTVYDPADTAGWQGFSPVRELVRPACSVCPEITVKEVKAMLADQPPQTSVVVVENEAPVGLLMQYNMDRHLSTQFGMSLYYYREVGRIMDTHPLVIDVEMSVEEAARAAMSREGTKVYDDIVVTENGRLLGAVSVQGMLDKLAEMQVELAKGANPLSGLPGNVVIERELEKRVKNRQQTSMVYVDLDNFKVYNDVFGFERGDKIILLTARTLTLAVDQVGNQRDFVGHVGGDDFIILAEPGHVQAICDTVLAVFAEETPSLYRDEDIERGYIVGKGRDGQVRQFPLVSLSLAVLDCTFQERFSMDGLSERVAEVKKLAKNIEGNSCVREPFDPAVDCPTAS
ncbi:GGDEF domain-containing protein [Oceanidesulfovibrio marinus]|nr:GGDEF domain-containing protein [Oceanidesulfovibrio marinus]